ncbi:MAG: 1-acyl-sn-glycerol-3-phosphate acyltransferase [Chloroflexi bacterium]|nr:1-acyl-sn-glycerol-3-phosphate acyltransferase [Chloroflexota bacterium]
MNRIKFQRGFYKTVRFLLQPVFKAFLNYHSEPVRITAQPALILANHTTNLDPVMMGISFPDHMLFVASEHIFRLGWLSRLIVFFLNPIMRVKARTELRTASEIMKTLRSGINVCMFAEGSASWNGESGEIPDSTIKLAHRSGFPLVTYRIEGGYLSMPRWGASFRRGKIQGMLIQQYSVEELRSMTYEELEAAIYRDLYFNIFQRNEHLKIAYKGQRLAEDLEALLFLCPQCHKIASIHSNGDQLRCDCGLQLRYTEHGLFESLTDTVAPFHTVLDWDLWQRQHLAETSLALREMPLDEPICSDEDQRLYRFQPGIRSELIACGRLALYRDRLELQDARQHQPFIFPLSTISDMALIIQRLLTFTVNGEDFYEVKSTLPRSALKYVMICHQLADMRIML